MLVEPVIKQFSATPIKALCFQLQLFFFVILIAKCFFEKKIS